MSSINWFLFTHFLFQLIPKFLLQVEVEKVSSFLNDEDKTLSCEIFSTREGFLNYCLQNHYEFGTLRRAKHSSMMILYNLHTAKCNTCSNTIEPALGWQCMTCSGFHICDSCYQKDGCSSHDHQLVPRANATSFFSHSKETQSKLYWQVLNSFINLMNVMPWMICMFYLYKLEVISSFLLFFRT